MGKVFKIPFAFDKEGNVFDWRNAEKKTDYLCQCGETVRLRGGDFISNHFYHISETECSNESIIHKAYKSTFLTLKKVRLPVKYNGNDFIEFDKVELEKSIGDFTPDAIGYKDDKMYLIEFAKTSYIGEIKRNKIKKANLFCLEISILDSLMTIDDIKEHLIKWEYHKNIIHAPSHLEMEEFKQKARKEYVKLKEKHDEEIQMLTAKYNKEILSESEDFAVRHMKKYKGVRLYFNKKCANGALLYTHSSVRIIAFVKEGELTIKIK